MSEAPQAEGVATKTSPRTVGKTVDRLTEIVASKDLTLFAVVDHSSAAASAGLSMPDTKLVLLGSPAAGTPVMVAAPLVALDLPLKVLVWADREGTVRVSYNTPAYLATRHHLTDDQRSRFEAIDAITDATVAPAS